MCRHNIYCSWSVACAPDFASALCCYIPLLPTVLLTSYCCWYPCCCRRPLCRFWQRYSCRLFISTLLLQMLLLHCWLLAASSAVACVPDFANPAVANVPDGAGFPILLTSLYCFWRPCCCCSPRSYWRCTILQGIPCTWVNQCLPCFFLIYLVM